ncbi:GspH/FimT family protein [Microbulbifer aggregans]|uniref:GspH/FimT family protein n=1 Tax=Microbulbifer aggregans TaxID=1769779 RepID=UPI001CFDB785|nr:GspH/FimT family pseudopilin [Microbulbifer aggregans]
MRRANGFTLLEFIITASILAILTAIAAAPTRNLVQRYRSEIKARELFEILTLMRSHAYAKRRKYSLCPSSDSYNCGTDWAMGALLFEDKDADGTRDQDERVERLYSGAEPGARLTWNGFNNQGYLIFNPDGTTPAQSGNFKYCPPGGDAKYGWIIVLNAIGRPYFGKDKDGDGIAETGGGENLNCDYN